MDEGCRRALDMLRAAVTPRGFLASTEETTNYRRIWARDGVVCGLAGLVCDDAALTEALGATLRTLAAHQGPHGEIPSNVRLGAEGEVDRVSYGGTVGRVDCVPWFVIGAGAYCERTRDRRLADELEPRIARALELLAAWELNRGGLVYVPQGGTWADEYPQHGYLLYVQLLRLWALGCREGLYGDRDAGRQAAVLAERIRVNYWPARAQLGSDLVHSRRLYERVLEAGSPPGHFLCGFNPSGYYPRFDAWSNALSVILGLPSRDQLRDLLAAGQALRSVGPTGLVPCFWPPISPADPEWAGLRATAAYGFKNEPAEYHNGGIWPMVNGWWGLALVRAGRIEEARELVARIDRLNRGPRDSWDFPEYANATTGEPKGTRRLAWSAAGSVLLHRALAGDELDVFGVAAP